MRILGIDPGLQTTGFGVIEREGQHLRYVASGTIRTTRTEGVELGNLPARLKILYEGISEIVERYQPEVAAIEIVFVNVNPQSTLLLGQARGAALTALVTNDLPVAEYTALQMKKPSPAMAVRPKGRFRKWSNACCSCPACPAPTRPMHWDWLSPTPMQAPCWTSWGRNLTCAAGSTPCSKLGAHTESVRGKRPRSAGVVRVQCYQSCGVSGTYKAPPLR